MAKWLTGQWVLVTAVKPTEREQLSANVQLCGGEVVSSFYSKDPPHLVITRNPRSQKYRMLMRVHPHTPVVTPDWLADSLKAGQRLPYDAYRVRPFHGLTICFSGLPAATKNALAAEVAAGGGLHSPALDKKCTHLVTDQTGSAKYNFAVREGIVVVSVKWVEDCVEAGWCKDEAPYAVKEEAPTRSRVSQLLVPPPPPGPGSVAATAAAAPLTHAAEDGGTCMSWQAGPPAVAPTAHANETQPGQRGPSRLQHGSSAGDAAAHPAAGKPQPQQQLQQQQQGANQPTEAELDEQLDWDDATPPFLDSVHLKLVGCSPAEVQECLQLVRQSAARRYADWFEELNHLLIGSDLDAAAAAEAFEFLNTHRSCHIVSIDWLRQSVVAQKRLPPDAFLIHLSRLAQYRRRPPGVEQLEAASRAERAPSSSGSGDAAGGSGKQSAPLSGCYFTLAALRGRPQEEQTARDLIQLYGGRLFTDTTLQRVTDKSRAFAICPYSLVSQEATLLRNTCPDFKLVDEKQRFTLYWLEWSIRAGWPLPPDRGAPLYQPLPYPLPLPCMRDVVVSISGYDGVTREAIILTVETLGGKVTPENMTPRNTHLLLPLGKGMKFEKSRAFGVIPVTADWLVDTAYMGRRMPEENYYPKLAPGQLPPQPAVPRAPRGTTSAGTAPVQTQVLGPTQMLTGAAPGQQQQGLLIPGPQQQAQQRQQSQGGRQQQHYPPHPLPMQPPPLQQPQQSFAPPLQQPQQQAEPQHQVQRPQVALPPPPTAQHQQQISLPGNTGGRRLSLRERMQATQAASAQLQSHHYQQQQQQPLHAGLASLGAANDENTAQGSNGGAPAPLEADLLHLGAKQPLTAAFQPAPSRPQPSNHQQQPQQGQGRGSALDDAMASLDEGLKQAQQQQQQPVSSSMFDALFGSDPSLGPGAVGGAAQAGAAPAAAEAPPPQLADSQYQQQAEQQEGAKQAGRPSTGRATRSSSRLRPNQQASQPQPRDADPSPAPRPLAAAAAAAAGGAAAAAEAVAAAAVGSGSEPQDDFGRAVERLGDLLGGLPPDMPPRHAMMATQLDIPLDMMPPPPARGRAAAPAESGLSNGSGGGSRGRGAKRALNDDGGAASGGSAGGRVQQLRRSGRGRATPDAPQPAPHLEMSQQVGYAEADCDALPPRMATRSSSLPDKQQLKRQLVETAAAGRQLRGGGAAGKRGRSADPLADLL